MLESIPSVHLDMQVCHYLFVFVSVCDSLCVRDRERVRNKEGLIFLKGIYLKG